MVTDIDRLVAALLEGASREEIAKELARFRQIGREDGMASR